MKKFIAAMALVPLLIIGACETSSERDILVDLAIQSATVRYIGDDQDRAQRVLVATDVVRVAMVQNPESTVLSLAELAHGLVPRDHLTPQEVLLANALINLVVVEVSEQFGGGTVLTPEMFARVSHYLDQVDLAANLVVSS